MLDKKTVGSDSTQRHNGHKQGPIVALSYSSVPSEDLSSTELKLLLEQSRRNNSLAHITGIILVREASIFQWLEGPERAIDELMDRIVSDPRHSNVEVLERVYVTERFFGPWTMLLATDDNTSKDLPNDAIHIATNTIAENHGNALSHASLKAFARQARIAAVDQAIISAAGRIDVRSLPKESAVQPFDVQLSARLHAQEEFSNREKWDLAASALTTLLLENDFWGVEHFLRAMSRREADPLPLQISLLEQSERKLGDLWFDNLCSDVEINSALSDMIRALRSVNFGTLPVWRVPSLMPNVLVVTQPGERHMLSAVLDAEVLWQHGWSPALEFPRHDEELQQILSGHWYEAVDISMSGVFRRPEKLDGLIHTIELARSASANPDIAITVGGRAVYEDPSLLISLGVDALVTSATDVEFAIHDAIKRSQN